MLPWWRRAMLDYRVRHTGWSDWLRRNARTLQQVRDAIAQNGPMANADFEGRRARGGAGWWNWKPVQHALHYLWMSGALAIHSRRHFHKRFDLLERAMPDALAAEAVSAGDLRNPRCPSGLLPTRPPSPLPAPSGSGGSGRTNRCGERGSRAWRGATTAASRSAPGTPRGPSTRTGAGGGRRAGRAARGRRVRSGSTTSDSARDRAR